MEEGKIWYGEEEINMVVECLNKGWLSGTGDKNWWVI